jgi:hypothetical protein
VVSPFRGNYQQQKKVRQHCPLTTISNCQIPETSPIHRE